MYKIQLLPLSQEIETKKILKKVAEARSSLAELKGTHGTIPNINILLNTLALQEAKDSSGIENIVTTRDELYKSELSLYANVSTKEVQQYAQALKIGFELVQKNKLITNSTILEIHQELERNNAGYRKLPGTNLQNGQEIVYTPPQDATAILEYMQNLVNYINNDDLDDLDFLVKMAIIHHQFESIHPFYDGNGRTGRIINILYLISKDLLDFPSLYLSRYIIQNKVRYYQLLQSVRETQNWEEWILFVLDAVITVSRQSALLIKEIKKEMQFFKVQIKTQLPKIYSQDLINNLFRHPYTKIEFVMQDLKVSRITSTKYLKELTKLGLLDKSKIGKENYYTNKNLVAIFTNFDYQL